MEGCFCLVLDYIRHLIYSIPEEPRKPDPGAEKKLPWAWEPSARPSEPVAGHEPNQWNNEPV